MTDYWLRKQRDLRLTRRRVVQGGAVLGVGAVAGGLAGCGDDGNGKQPPASDSPGAGGSPAAGASPAAAIDKYDLNAEIRVAVPVPAASMDPQLAGGGPGAFTLYGGLFALDEATRKTEAYSASWEWTDSNKAIRIKAKPGIKFHDGSPFDADAIQFNFERILGKAAYSKTFTQSVYKGTIAPYVGEMVIEAPDTLLVRTLSPNVDLPLTLAGLFLVSKKAVTEKGDSEFAKSGGGFGPFKLVGWAPDQDLKVARYDEFFYGRDQPYGPRLPYAARVTIKTQPEPGSRVASLEAGEIDLAGLVNNDIARTYEGKKGFRTHYQPAQRGLHIQIPISWDLNPKTGQGPNPWKDKRVRQAANYAIDVDLIVKTLLTGKEAPTFPLDPTQFGYPAGIEQKRYKRDVQKAKTLLAEAGYPNGFEFDLNFGTGLHPGDTSFMPAIASQLQEAGFKVNLVANEPVTYNAQLRQKKIPMSLFSQLAGRSTNEALLASIHSKGTYTISYDPGLGLDALIEQATGEFDVVKRRSLVEQVVNKHYDEALWIYLHQVIQPHVSRDTIEWPVYSKQPPHLEYWNLRKLKA